MIRFLCGKFLLLISFFSILSKHALAISSFIKGNLGPLLGTNQITTNSSQFTKNLTIVEETTIEEILEEITKLQQKKKLLERPFVTVSYAQSLNGIIAFRKGQNESSSNFAISSEETRTLTHGIRAIHDGILIGSSTLAIDNPRLDIRLYNGKYRNCMHQPRPIIFDTYLTSIERLCSLKLLRMNIENDIIVCYCSRKNIKMSTIPSSIRLLNCRTKMNLEQKPRINITDALQQLRQNFNISSIMVEGGMQIISSFLSEDMFDCILVTISSQYFSASNGLNTFQGLDDEVMKLIPVKFWKVGEDFVLLAVTEN